MSSNIVREFSTELNIGMKIHDFRIQLSSAEEWLSTLFEMKDKIQGDMGVLRMQIGNDVKYSEMMKKDELTTDFIENFMEMFQMGDLHSYDEVISFVYICV